MGEPHARDFRPIRSLFLRISLRTAVLRLLHDDRLRLLVLTHALKGGMPQHSRAGPFGELHFADDFRSEEHPSELQSLMRISYAVFCWKKKHTQKTKKKETIKRPAVKTT